MRPELTDYETGLAGNWSTDRLWKGLWGYLIILIGIAIFAIALIYLLQKFDTDGWKLAAVSSLVIAIIPVGALAALRNELLKRQRRCYEYVYKSICRIIEGEVRHKPDMPPIEELRARRDVLYKYLQMVGQRRRTSEGPTVSEDDIEDFEDTETECRVDEHAEAVRILNGETRA